MDHSREVLVPNLGEKETDQGRLEAIAEQIKSFFILLNKYVIKGNNYLSFNYFRISDLKMIHYKC